MLISNFDLPFPSALLFRMQGYSYRGHLQERYTNSTFVIVVLMHTYQATNDEETYTIN